MDILRPFEPSASEPWDAAKAAHLARRAGFGATSEEVARLVELGPGGAVTHLVDFPARDEELEAELAEVGGELTELREVEGTNDRQRVARLRRWWLYRMVHGNAPLQEKLTLFWHDHFACQESKVLRAELLLRQNELFRRHAAGSFRELLRGVARDPATLVFLDNRLNTRENPNENWARELLELFTLGVDHYTQADVEALARIYTGWTTPAPHAPEFGFRPERHDAGDKLLFGASLAGRAGAAGIDEGDEALERILAHEECATFLAGKLCAWFVTDAPCPDQARALGEVLRAADWDLRETLRVLLRSAWFHAPQHRFGLYKNPVEYVVGAARRLGVQNAHLAGLDDHCRVLGMDLFEPPSVAGWTHGAAWIDSGALIQRFNLALALAEVPHTRRRVTGCAALDFDGLAPEHAAQSENGAPGDLLDAIGRRLLDRPLTSEQQRAIEALLADPALRSEADLSPTARRRREVRAAVHMVLTTPEFALA